MRFGMVVPSSLPPEVVVDFGVTIEQRGWDAIFVWDTLYDHDAWVLLTAVAMRTERIRLGTIVTPVARHLPWRLATETATLDRLSNGRVILLVGLGVAEDEKWSKLGMTAEMDRRVRARKLDEGLAIVDGMWSGKPFSFSGEHYHVDDVQGRVTPVQFPRIPIWVTAKWPDPPGTMLRRMPRWDGVLIGDDPERIRPLKSYLDGQRGAASSSDIVAIGDTFDLGPQAGDWVRERADAGATWWIEDVWQSKEDLPRLRERIMRGPPRPA